MSLEIEIENCQSELKKCISTRAEVRGTVITSSLFHILLGNKLHGTCRRLVAWNVIWPLSVLVLYECNTIRYHTCRDADV